MIPNETVIAADIKTNLPFGEIGKLGGETRVFNTDQAFEAEARLGERQLLRYSSGTPWSLSTEIAGAYLVTEDELGREKRTPIEEHRAEELLSEHRDGVWGKIWTHFPPQN